MILLISVFHEGQGSAMYSILVITCVIHCDT